MKNNKKVTGQLLNILRDLSSSLDLQFTLNKIITRSLELLDSKGATIYLIDSDKQILKPAITHDPPFEAQVMAQNVDVKSSLSGKVVNAKKGMIFNNASQNPDAYKIPGTSSDDDEHLMVLPLLVEKEILGTLNVYRREKLYFKEDFELAEIFAWYVSTSIQNAQAHQDLIREIKERKQVEDALKSSEERLKVIFESALDAIYMTDLNGTFIDGNKTAEDLMGYKKEELIGKSFLKLKLLSAKELPKALKLLVNNVQGKGTGPDEFTLKRKDGTQVIVEISTYPVKIKNKMVVLGIARNITKRKKAEEKIISRNKELEIWAEVTTNRELFMLDLKKEINELLEKSGEKSKYEIPI